MQSGIGQANWISVIAVCGFIAFVGLFLWTLHRKTVFSQETKLKASILLIVNNQADIIEGFVRELWGLVAKSKQWILDINIVDENSSDETARILERLWFYFPIKVASWRRLSGVSAFEIGRFLCDQPFIWVVYLNGEGDRMAYLSTLKRMIQSHHPASGIHLPEVRV